MNKQITSSLLVFTIFLSLFLTSCNSGAKESSKNQASEDNVAKGNQPISKKADNSEELAKAAYLNRPWKIDLFPGNNDGSEKTKFIKTRAEGKFSNSSVKGAYVFVEVLCTKINAGIFLHEYDQSRPSRKLSGTTTIKMTNSKNEELTLASIESWSDSGGIRIKNHGKNKYLEYHSQLVNYLKSNSGEIKVVISDENASVYSFKIDGRGFAEEFNSL